MSHLIKILCCLQIQLFGFLVLYEELKHFKYTVKILKFGTPQTIAIIVLKLVKFDVTLH